LYVTKVNLVKSDCNTQPNKKQEVAIEKQLIVKEKKEDIVYFARCLSSVYKLVSAKMSKVR